jgi:D-alanyl-D-alanine carboxypeptidase/D-alanyl-D-alanine-endopeptidase (penicillin-binding protein 4)
VCPSSEGTAVLQPFRRRKVPALFVPALIAAAFAAAPVRSAEPVDPAVAALRARLDGKLAPVAKWGAVYGIRVVSLKTGEVLYSVNAEGVPAEPAAGVEAALRLFLPASNMKLITTAAALDQLGEDYEFRTVLALRGADLVVIGGGDPAFGDPAVSSGGESGAAAAELARWAAAVKARGINRVGALLIDDSIFDAEFVHPSWPRDQLNEWFCAPVGGLNLQTNCLEVKVAPTASGGAPAVRLNPPVDFFRVVNQARSGGAANVLGLSHGRVEHEFVLRGNCAKPTVEPLNVAVRDPGMYFGHALHKALVDAGVTVAGGVKRTIVRSADGRLPADLDVLTERRTPLAAVVARCNKKSQNMYAECLIKALGAAYRGPAEPGPFVGSWRRGAAAVERFLNKLHLPDESRRIADGSGLSRDNGVTPMLITEVLVHMHGRPAWAIYRDSLSVGGVDGTLARRLRDPGLKGSIFGKTGYIRGVSALSGYARTPSGELLAFSMIFNDIKGAVTTFKELEDEIGRELVRYGPPAPAAQPAAGRAPTAKPRR